MAPCARVTIEHVNLPFERAAGYDSPAIIYSDCRTDEVIRVRADKARSLCPGRIARLVDFSNAGTIRITCNHAIAGRNVDGLACQTPIVTPVHLKAWKAHHL